MHDRHIVRDALDEVHIVFDDGHDSGLYDWRYLYDLGRKQSIYWTQYLDRLSAKGHVRRPPSR